MEKLQYNLGLALDTRLPFQKAKDYQHSDLAGAIILDWKEKAPSEWKKYTPREQDGSLSCCGQSAAKAIETMNGIVESAHPIYRNRSNFPEAGMYLADVGRICRNIGTNTEVLDISQFQNEQALNRDINVPTPVTVGGYIFVAPKDINAIASAIELNRHCLLIFHCNKDEWKKIPQYSGDSVNFGHCVTGVDYFLKDGVKYILIEDSTGHSSSFDKNGQRLISEDFLKARCDGAMYLVQEIPKPKFIFTQTLRLGSIGNEVKQLQLRLKIGADGIFGQKTKMAVVLFQLENHLAGDGVVGPLTRGILNL